MTTAREILEILRERRQRFGIRSCTIAEEIGVHRVQMSLWEKGGREPRFDTLCKWARALGMTIDIRED